MGKANIPNIGYTRDGKTETGQRGNDSRDEIKWQTNPIQETSMIYQMLYPS